MPCGGDNGNMRARGSTRIKSKMATFWTSLTTEEHSGSKNSIMPPALVVPSPPLPSHRMNQEWHLIQAKPPDYPLQELSCNTGTEWVKQCCHEHVTSSQGQPKSQENAAENSAFYSFGGHTHRKGPVFPDREPDNLPALCYLAISQASSSWALGGPLCLHTPAIHLSLLLGF